MEEPVLLSGFSNTDLVDLIYHSNPEDYTESYIEIEARDRTGKRRRLRFEQVSNLEIEKDFSGCLSGMIIVDIKSRQWGGSRVEVQNFEQDPGVTFLAMSMDIIFDEFCT